MADVKSKKIHKKKGKKVVHHGIVHIRATFNNTIVSFTDLQGNILCWSSAGSLGFKGSRKSTPYAAQRAAEVAAEKARDFQLREVEVRVQGPGAGRESAARALGAAGLKVFKIMDVTKLPHNGVRRKKKRRV